jgi:shikimate 5-dehydrogenase
VVSVGGASTTMVVRAALDGVAKIYMFNRKDRFYESG